MKTILNPLVQTIVDSFQRLIEQMARIRDTLVIP